MLVATAVTLALLGFVGSALSKLLRQDGDKILAALQGRSWTAQRPAPTRPIAIRFSRPCRAAESARVPAGLRAAA